MRKSAFGLLLFLITWWIFYASPVYYLSESQFSLLMDEAILHHGTPNMIDYKVPRGNGTDITGLYPWQLTTIKGRLLYTCPWGAALLSLPAVAAFNALGFHVAPNHVYTIANEAQMQRLLSSGLCAAAVWLLYQTAALLLPIGWSLAIAVGTAFGTQFWSNASRSLWHQTWYLLLAFALIRSLLSVRLRPVLLSTLISWLLFVRPTAWPTAFLVSIYVLLETKDNWTRIVYFLTTLIWSAALGSLIYFFMDGHIPLCYRLNVFALGGFFPRLEGILFSPSRGLFIFLPISILPLYLTGRYFTALSSKRLAMLAILIIISIIALLGMSPVWWGGFSYGPRELTDTVPWFVVLTILGISTFLKDSHLTMYECSAVVSSAMLLLAVSISMNAPGALSFSASNWNQVPNVDEHPERLWDWQHPQWLAWVQNR